MCKILYRQNDIAIAGAIVEPGIIQAVISLKRAMSRYYPPSILSAVYVDSHRDKRQRVFKNIQQTSEVGASMLAAGDFNTLLEAQDKLGGKRPIQQDLQEHQECTMQTGLQRMEAKGDRFTWTNKRLGDQNIQERFYYVFTNDKWNYQYPDTEALKMLSLEAEVQWTTY